MIDIPIRLREITVNVDISVLVNILYLFTIKFFRCDWLKIFFGESVCPECNIGFCSFVDIQKITGAKLGIAVEKTRENGMEYAGFLNGLYKRVFGILGKNRCS